MITENELCSDPFYLLELYDNLLTDSNSDKHSKRCKERVKMLDELELDLFASLYAYKQESEIPHHARNLAGILMSEMRTRLDSIQHQDDDGNTFEDLLNKIPSTGTA